MPYIGFSKVKTLEGYERYNMKARDGRTVATAPEALDDNMSQAIRDEHERFPKKNLKNHAYSIVQSWHEKESKLYSPEQFNEMGRQLAERFAPGHLVWVTTHTDKAHMHNHIVICSVHSETGARLKHDEADIDRMHVINNEIARAHGLALMNTEVGKILKKLPHDIRDEVRQGKQTWILDMVQKADFARKVSTSFDEYAGYLNELGVQARVENKNISYQYGEHKPKRGKKLGFDYDKDGLVKAFKENDEKFAKNPELREQLLGRFRAAGDGKRASLGNPGDLPLESTGGASHLGKDYEKFTKVDRRADPDELPATFHEPSGLFHQEMKKAQGKSITDYCREQKIELKLNKKGETVVKGREFVVIHGNEWTNRKNDLKGGLIEFVAIHDETNYLRAMAKINKNPRLLILEEAVGEAKSGYRPFTLPKHSVEGAPVAQKALTRLLASRGFEAHAAEVILKSERLHHGQDGSLWLMGEGNEATFEYNEEPGGAWRGKRHGKPTATFLEKIGSSSRLVVFQDPFTFAHASASGAKALREGASVLVLFGDESGRRVDELLALHTHIRELHVANSARAEERTRDTSAVHEMNQRYRSFGVEVKEIPFGDLGKAKGRGPDISF